MRALGYVRYDAAAARNSPASLASQEGELRRYAQEGGHTLAAMYDDPLSSGAEGFPGLSQMLQQLKGMGGQCIVLVNEAAHLGPTLEAALEVVLQADALGAKVVCSKVGFPDPVQELYGLMSRPAQGAERRQRIIDAMHAKAVRGEGLGKPPYGYRIGDGGRFEEVPEEAEVVKLAFALYLEGHGLRTLARQVNEKGYRTRRGRSWSMVTLRDILRNRVYTGTYERFGMRLPRNHPPLVSPEAFRKVQDMLQSRRPRRRPGERRPFALSGLAYCAGCGNKMIGVTRRQLWRRMDGSRGRGSYRYYQCQSRANQGVCEYHTRRADALEKAVWKRVQQKVSRLFPTFLQETPGKVAQQAENGLSRRLYMKYVKQAADGAISLGRLRSLLQKGGAQPLVTTGVGSASPAPDAGKADGGEVDYSVRRQVLLQWVERIEVGEGRRLVVVVRQPQE